MKIGILTLLGALVGAGVMFGIYRTYPPGADDLAELQQELANAQFDRDASRKVEIRLRQQVTDLRRSAAAQLAATISTPATSAAMDASGNKPKADGEKSSMSEVMQSIGKAKSELAFRTLVDRLGLEGESLEAFTAVFEAARTQRQEAFTNMFRGGATLEQFAIIGGATPNIDAWVAANLEGDELKNYADYKAQQEQNRIDRKANEELGMLGSIANLSAEQKDAAFAVFAEHVAAEPPEDLLEMSGPEEFSPYLDNVIASRFEALAPILDEEQMTVYQAQSQLWRKMAEDMLAGNGPKH